MSWISFGSWHCVYSDDSMSIEDIKFFVEAKKKPNLLGSFFGGNLDNIAYFMRDRNSIVLSLKGVPHSIKPTKDQEIDFQTKGYSEYYLISFFKKDKYSRGDIVAVFSDSSKFISEPYLNHKKTILDFEKLSKKEYVANIFISHIRNDINKIEEEKIRIAEEEKENKRRNRQEELERLKQIEENERNSKLRMQEEENRNRSRLLSEKERLEKETEEIKKRIDIQTMSAIEEKNLTAELLEMRERIARIDEETSQKRINSILDAFKSVNSNGLKVK